MTPQSPSTCLWGNTLPATPPSLPAMFPSSPTPQGMDSEVASEARGLLTELLFHKDSLSNDMHLKLRRIKEILSPRPERVSSRVRVGEWLLHCCCYCACGRHCFGMGSLCVCVHEFCLILIQLHCTHVCVCFYMCVCVCVWYVCVHMCVCCSKDS